MRGLREAWARARRALRLCRDSREMAGKSFVRRPLRWFKVLHGPADTRSMAKRFVCSPPVFYRQVCASTHVRCGGTLQASDCQSEPHTRTSKFGTLRIRSTQYFCFRRNPRRTEQPCFQSRYGKDVTPPVVGHGHACAHTHKDTHK